MYIVLIFQDIIEFSVKEQPVEKFWKGKMCLIALVSPPRVPSCAQSVEAAMLTLQEQRQLAGGVQRVPL